MKKPKTEFKDIGAAMARLSAHPVTSAAVLLAVYFLMDSYMLNCKDELGGMASGACLAFAFLLFYIGYVARYQFGNAPDGCKDMPGWVRNRKHYAVDVFLLLGIFVAVVALGYDAVMENCFPNLGVTYYRSQVFLLVFIAPLLEELVFRYFLYDRWARIKFGVWKGVLLSGFIFVICHPVTGLDSLVLYWAPTILFYLIYDSFGLYGSVVAHMVFNFIAL